MGGLMWCVALKYGPDYLVGHAVEGPSDPKRGGWASFAKDVSDSMEYWDDVLAPQERHLLCGTYIVISGTTSVFHLPIADIKIINRIKGKAKCAAIVHSRDGLMVPLKKYGVGHLGLGQTTMSHGSKSKSKSAVLERCNPRQVLNGDRSYTSQCTWDMDQPTI
jgi:hypothetical protein